MKYDIRDLMNINSFLEETLEELQEHNINESGYKIITAIEYVKALNDKLEKMVNEYKDELAIELGEN